MYLSSDYRRLVGLVSHPPADTLASTWSICLAIFVLTMAVNAAAVVVLGKKEKTGVNQLVVFDCFANVLTALVQMVNMVHLSNWLFDCSGQIRKKS